MMMLQQRLKQCRQIDAGVWWGLPPADDFRFILFDNMKKQDFVQYNFCFLVCCLK